MEEDDAIAFSVRLRLRIRRACCSAAVEAHLDPARSRIVQALGLFVLSSDVCACTSQDGSDVDVSVGIALFALFANQQNTKRGISCLLRTLASDGCLAATGCALPALARGLIVCLSICLFVWLVGCTCRHVDPAVRGKCYDSSLPHNTMTHHYHTCRHVCLSVCLFGWLVALAGM